MICHRYTLHGESMVDEPLVADHREIEFSGGEVLTRLRKKNPIFRRCSLCPSSLLRIHALPSLVDEKYSRSGRRRNCNKYNVVGGKIFVLSFVARATNATHVRHENRKYILRGREDSPAASAVRPLRRQGSRVLRGNFFILLPHPFAPVRPVILFFAAVPPLGPLRTNLVREILQIPRSGDVTLCVTYSRRFAATRSGSPLFVRVYRNLRALSFP